jgi:hypothetical protein
MPWETIAGYFKKLGTIQSMYTVVYPIKGFFSLKDKRYWNIDAQGW